MFIGNWQRSLEARIIRFRDGRKQLAVELNFNGYSTQVYIATWRFDVYTEHTICLARWLVRKCEVEPVEVTDDHMVYKVGPFTYVSYDPWGGPEHELVTLAGKTLGFLV
jgi:hypothetical protein